MKTKTFKTYIDYLKNIINQIIEKTGLKAEIEKLWLWISEKPYTKNRQILIKYGFIYSKKRGAWYLPKIYNEPNFNILSIDFENKQYL